MLGGSRRGALPGEPLRIGGDPGERHPEQTHLPVVRLGYPDSGRNELRPYGGTAIVGVQFIAPAFVLPSGEIRIEVRPWTI